MGLIAVYDSGIGGITVLSRLVQKFKDREFLYYGDNARMPYGNKSRDDLIAIAKESLAYLSSYSPEAIVFACNTLTECALPQLQSSIPVVGVSPTAFLCFSFPKPTAVLCTPLTAAQIQNSLPKWCTVFAAKGLAGEVERGITEKETEVWIARLSELLRGRFSRLHLGCTHYVWLKEKIKAAFPNLEITDGVAKCEHLLSVILSKRQKYEKGAMENCLQKNPAVHFVGECAIKNQNTYLHLQKHLFNNC